MRINSINNTEGRTISPIVRLSFFHTGDPALVVIALIAVLGCGLFGCAPGRRALPSEAADATADSSFTHVPLQLNMQYLGTTSDLRGLRNMITDIMRQRASAGVFKVGSNEVENTVWVEIDKKIPIGVLAEIVLAINESGGRAYLPTDSARERAGPITPQMPNPTTLILTADKIPNRGSALHILGSDEADEWAFAPDFEMTTDPDTLKLRRIVQGSIEIAANGDYFLNPLLRPDQENELDTVKIEQKPIDRSAVKNGALGLLDRAEDRPELTVVASEHALSENLYALFSALEGNDVRWRVIVRGAPKKPNRKQ